MKQIVRVLLVLLMLVCVTHASQETNNSLFDLRVGRLWNKTPYLVGVHKHRSGELQQYIHPYQIKKLDIATKDKQLEVQVTWYNLESGRQFKSVIVSYVLQRIKEQDLVVVTYNDDKTHATLSQEKFKIDQKLLPFSLDCEL